MSPMTWNELLEQRAKGAGPEIVDVIQEPEGRTTIVVKPDPAKTGPLADALRHLYSAAEIAQGQVVSHRLAHGLRIDLKIDAAGALSLLLARRIVYPSAQEIETVRKHFPVQLDGPAERIAHGEWLAVCIRRKP